jgi:hypothetical protein
MCNVINQLLDGDTELVKGDALRAVSIDSLQRQKVQGRGVAGGNEIMSGGGGNTR